MGELRTKDTGIDVIVFSKDRAAQLDLLLTSLAVHNNLFKKPKVIYRTSNIEYEKGYDIIRKYNTAHFQKEQNFYRDVMESVKRCGRLFCFMVDDQIWLRSGPTYLQVKQHMDAHPQAVCLSCRLGRNTTYQYQTQRHIELPEFMEVGPFLLWDRNTCPHRTNFNYPLSVDAHIFRRDEILTLLEQIRFQQPNQLEGRLQARRFVNHVGPMMLCPQKSLIVNAVVNRVQDVCANRVGNRPEYKADVMNNRFLSGDRLDLDRTNLKNIAGCHQEIDLQWASRRD